MARELPRVYERGGIHAFLMSPAVWEGSECRGEGVRRDRSAAVVPGGRPEQGGRAARR